MIQTDRKVISAKNRYRDEGVKQQLLHNRCVIVEKSNYSKRGYSDNFGEIMGEFGQFNLSQSRTILEIDKNYYISDYYTCLSIHYC